jgi:hypothetical protein
MLSALHVNLLSGDHAVNKRDRRSTQKRENGML